MAKNIEILARESYLALIKNSVGSTLFRSIFARVRGKKTDIMRNGDLSCAFYVSSILTLAGLAKAPHATVDSTLADMKQSGWKTITRPKVGCVIVWEEKHFEESNEAHKHVGFYVGSGKAVSNSDKKRAIAQHSYRSHNGRGITQLLWHPRLDT